ncbi:Gfo/Idh/MocA family protein [Pontibacter sp. HSC-36F09]|uniref:Gfo/Idh/MocA family protein n=1 Tax=Pontibacter sp. HSC-36F09 TaxID=2910966 RepID=UPI00209F6A87|nr:Gfo/Idh/MocA family oxidoreductase [Pontibacter sp. HSC-36F09]MCP2043675.1 putative dehydrogenase [Pontibacter sp. HSC-36F09]
MKVLIIGLGSIAQKHVNALRQIKPDVELIALRTGEEKPSQQGISNIYHLNEVSRDVAFAIISNPTSKHLETIRELTSLRIPLFIEKPPLATLDGAIEIVQYLEREEITTYTAFNFRFHPVVQWIKENIKNKRVLEVQAYCGSYLPEWRANVDYRNVYSSKKELGGGVHLDLIHELDYVTWLFGKPNAVHGYTSKVSDLEIDSPDVAHYWLQYESMNASIVLNYYRRDSKRSLEVVFDNGIWFVDLINFKVIDSFGKVLFEAVPDVLATYVSQMSYFISCLEEGNKPMNDLSESIETLKLCLAVEN